MRSLLSRILVVGCLALLTTGACAGVAGAQGANPFTPLPPAPVDTSTLQTSTSTSTTTTDDGLERWQEVLIFLAGIALLTGIGVAIVGDAKRKAPVSEAELEGAHKPSPAGARKAQSKAKNRKKAKAQRQARKHNR
ncbi:hypothetical protein DSM112329_02558 [Paraconexibacter sp. AEG42_29]|uniref:Uncharacterized protein n=1 Tax=Paraconexibacter sp. AEG42_29 TaxID=2997339 RepID=A0AAU7AVF5_9ACTN